MSKRRFLVLVVLGILSVGVYNLEKRPIPNDYCAFCDDQVLNRQKFYEDDLVMALYTHRPILPGHTMVIPKRHVERFENLTDEEFTRIGIVLKKIDVAVKKVFGTSASLLLQKNGIEAGRSVPHVHFHYIPKKAGDNSPLMFIARMYLANIRGPISADEMKENVEKLKAAINSDSSLPES